MACLLVGAVALMASLAAACGDDGDAPAAGSEHPGSVSSGGMIRPNTFLTYDGQRYELVNMLQASLVAEDEFEAVGEASLADIDLTDPRVFLRDGDSGAIFTYSASTADDGAFWLAWRLVG